MLVRNQLKDTFQVVVMELDHAAASLAEEVLMRLMSVRRLKSSETLPKIVFPGEPTLYKNPKCPVHRRRPHMVPTLSKTPLDLFDGWMAARLK